MSTLKKKEKVRPETRPLAEPFYDDLALQDQLHRLLKEVKILHEDAKQASKNIYDGEVTLGEAKAGLNAVLQKRKLVIHQGQI